jgi:hypothetical protein
MTTANQVMPVATCTEAAGERSKPILLIAVASTQLAAVGYDPVSRELVIKFQAGRPDRRSIPMRESRPSWPRG